MTSNLVRRAKVVFAGHKWTRGPLAEPWLLNDDRFPKFLAKGEGSRVVDVDGRSFIDYHCGMGASVLGYGYGPVEQAAAQASVDTGGQLLPGPTPWSVHLAERLVKQREGAEWCIFAKNGSDAT